MTKQKIDKMKNKTKTKNKIIQATAAATNNKLKAQ